VPPVANNEIFDYIYRRAGINADATGRHAASFLRVVLVEFEDISVFENQSQINDARAMSQICMLLEVAIVGMKNLGLSRLIISRCSS